MTLGDEEFTRNLHDQSFHFAILALLSVGSTVAQW